MTGSELVVDGGYTARKPDSTWTTLNEQHS